MEPRTRAGTIEQKTRAGAIEQRTRDGAIEQKTRTGAIKQRARAGTIDQRTRAGAIEHRTRAGAIEHRPRRVINEFDKSAEIAETMQEGNLLEVLDNVHIQVTVYMVYAALRYMLRKKWTATDTKAYPNSNMVYQIHLHCI